MAIPDEVPAFVVKKVITEVLYKLESAIDEGGWDQGHHVFLLDLEAVNATEAIVGVSQLAIDPRWWLRNEGRPGDTLRELASVRAMAGATGEPIDPQLVGYAIVSEGWITRIDENGSSPRIECRNVSAADRFGMNYWLCHERDSVIHEYLGDDVVGDVVDALTLLVSVSTTPIQGDQP